jgi:ferric-dicitrate binding protein FerR (iron transport regulator)
MEDNTKEDHDLLFKVLEGKALESEHRKFNEWLEKSAANREFFEELRTMRQSVLLEQSSMILPRPSPGCGPLWRKTAALF